jgi:hypothetical protein
MSASSRRAGGSGAKLARLRDPATDPAARADYARRLVATERNAELVLAALAALEPWEEPALRPVLLERYADYAAQPARRDPGGAVRAALLKALRPHARPDDVPLLEAATTTYEFQYGEVAGDLRAAALLTLARVDAVLAGYHAVRLLADRRHTSIMSGEPAATAARLLAAQRQFLPLYGYLMLDAEAIGDVTAECLRGLPALPATLLAALVRRYRESSDEIILLGLFDLLLAHESRPAYADFLLDFLRTTTLATLYRSLVMTLVAEGEPAMLAQLAAMAEMEPNRAKVAILREALALRRSTRDAGG